MELEQLKDMWKEQDQVSSPIDFQPILGKKSKSPIAIMKRHLNFELFFVLVSYGLVIAFYLIAFSGRFAVVAGMYIVIGLLFCLYYYKKYRLLNDMECMACQVKSNLGQQVKTLERYVRFYWLAGTAILPIIMIFFYWFEYTFLSPGGAHIFMLPSETVSMPASLGNLAIWITIATIAGYYVNRWYVKKLYGKHIDKLKQMLLQMEDETIAS
jgi:Flp pilus assembly protein TadB